MSATPQAVKAGMFGFIKNLFRKADDSRSPAAEAPSSGATARNTVPSSNGRANVSPNAPSTGPGVELPLDSILSCLPGELKSRVKPQNASSPNVTIPLDKILPQLARGVIRISFGDLRRTAPHLFSPAADSDTVPLVLPLAEVLSRVNPSLITRRNTQKTIEVPAEISSPFDSQGRGLTLSVAQTKSEMPPATPAAPVSPAPKPGNVPTPPERQGLNSAPSLQVPSLKLADSPSLSQRATPQSTAPEPSAVQGPPMVIPISVLSEGWPEAVRYEVFQANLLEAKLNLPAAQIEKSLAQGRIAFPWKTVRSWLTPPPPTSTSPYDDTIVELPLKIIAPLFLAKRREGQRRQKITVDENIPNLFTGAPKIEAASVPAPEALPSSPALTPPRSPALAKSGDTNYYPSDTTQFKLKQVQSESKLEPKPATTPGTSFVTRFATPNEVVSRAAALEGVAGALIALPDGLMVASQVSSEVNADTLAAFLPQIFSKVSQCTKELRMGELNNLNFTVGQIPWKIFRVNAIFFAAFGRSGETLPTGQLAALAAELDRKPK